MKLNKIFTMKTRPEISDQEIQSMMDFDKVLEVHRSTQKRNRVLLTAGTIGGAIVVLLMAWQFVRSPEPKQPLIQKPVDIPREQPKEPQNTPPAKEVAKEKEKKQEPRKEEPQAVVEPPQAYTEAEPVNGYPDLYAYFQRELKYPVEAVKDSIEGIVSVSFVINKEGKPEQVKILNSLGKAFDDEALRIVANMPPWKAASMNGKPVPARISMPLTFQITRTQKQ